MRVPSLFLGWVVFFFPVVSGQARPVVGTRGMVVTAHPLASEAAAEVLREGGTAADAAATAVFMLAVVEPYSSGLGGGGFALARHGVELTFIDFRERAPGAAHREMFCPDGKPNPTLAQDGPLAAGVPGAVAGYLRLHQRFGRLSRERILAPAIRAAEEGFGMDAAFAARLEQRLPLLRRDPEATRIFLVPGAEDGPAVVPPLGHRVVQRDLAWTLRQIAAHGADTFYRGAVAERLVSDMRERGGLISAADLRGYEPRERRPLLGSYLGHAIATAPPPSAGGEVLLNILNGMEVGNSVAPFTDLDRLRRFVEFSKRAFADRTLIGDPALVPDITAQLVAKDRAALLVKVLALQPWATPATEIPPGQGAQLPVGWPAALLTPLSEGDHTTHVSVIDIEGNAVSLTTTVNYSWGAGIVARDTGVVWNDEMDDFSTAPGIPNVYGVVGAVSNEVAPGKIPVSSMAPTIVFTGPTVDSPVQMVVGSPGGPRIPTTIAQIVIRYFADGAGIEFAVAAGRVHHQHLPDQVFVETFMLDPLTRRTLIYRGYHLAEERPWSNAQAIVVDPQTGWRFGAADPRGVGRAVAE